MENGMVQVYTGNGRGKSATAIGLALRSLGHGMPVFFVGFSGEHAGYAGYRSVDGLRGLPKLKEFSKSGMKRKAAEALEIASEASKSGRYKIVILDEVITAIDDELVSEKKVIEIMDNKKEETEIVMTGRRAGKNLIERADLVTRMISTRKPKRR